jgi:uncharacterized protein (TIGR02147 family)
MDLTAPNETEFIKESLKPKLSAYTDYREYLNDFLKFKQSLDNSRLRPYSYAHFSAAANIKSPNYLKLIIESKRNLSPSMTKKFSTALNHSKKEADEFTTLVSYCQSKEPLDRNHHLKKLSEIRMEKRINIGELDKKSIEDAPSWLSWVLLSICDQKNVNLNVDEIQKVIKRNLSPQQIKKSFSQLQENKDVIFNEESQNYEKKLSTNQQNSSIPIEMVRKLQTELIYLGLESLFQDKPEEREFGTVSLCLTKKEFDELKFELRHLRKKIYKDNLIQRESTKGEQVYQLNLQLFPLTKKVDAN